jgi:phosphoglycerate dehydrogenase-like enzyme
MSGRPVVVIPGDFPPMVGRSRHLNDLRQIADVIIYSDRPQSIEEKRRRLEPADILLNSRGAVQFTAEVISELPKLKMIAVCGIGYDAIHLPSATAAGIVVSNIPGKTAVVVAEHALALMLGTARRLPAMTNDVCSGRWSGNLGMSLAGRQVGIIGTGNIGCQMARICRGIGMDVVAWSFHRDDQKAAEFGFRYVELDELLKTSDAISLHVRLTEQTRGMIGRRELNLMKPTAILVNTARGPVVDTQALVDTLNSGHLFGAALDVYDSEPVPVDHPLLQCPNLVLTPHSADQTQEGLDLLTLGCVENIKAFLSGKPINVVNPEVQR